METATPAARLDRRGRTIDFYAAALAFLCLAHCVALPLLVTGLSLSIPFAENEAVHRALVLLAAPATAFAIFSDWGRGGRGSFIAAATAGLCLLFAGAFVHALEDFEQAITILGSVLLAGAHISRAWSSRN